MEKRLDEGLFQASDITYDETLLHNTKSSAADARDMARMGKPQEMKVQLALSYLTSLSILETDERFRSVTSVPSPCLASV